MTFKVYSKSNGIFLSTIGSDQVRGDTIILDLGPGIGKVEVAILERDGNKLYID